MKDRFIPSHATIQELEEKAAACERQAEQESEPLASALREEAKLYRDWIKRLRSGLWTS